MTQQTLQQIIQEIRAIRELNGVSTVIVNRVRERLSADVCNLFLISADQEEYRLQATSGLEITSESSTPMSLKRHEGLVGMVGERGEPINLEHPSVHPRYYHHPGIKDVAYEAFLGVPLIHRRQLVGVIIVLRQEADRFSEEDAAFLVTLAIQLAIVIAAAQTEHFVDSDNERTSAFRGVASSPGVAFGRAALVYPLADLDAVPERFVNNIEQEAEIFKAALRESKKDIAHLTGVLKDLPSEERELFEAYERILDSPDIVNAVLDKIQLGHWAQGALKQVIADNVAQLETLDDAYLRERATDIRDLGRRILMHLQSEGYSTPDYPENTILVGKEISPTALAEMPEGHLAGIVSQGGSTNSHVAILARALGVPTVMGVQALPFEHIEGKEIIIDGYYGEVYVSPSTQVKNEFTDLANEEKELMENLTKLRTLPAKTLDGHEIALYVNTGLATDIHQALTVGADGLGLFRTEVPFMMRERFPTEEEQRVLYKQLLSAFSPRPVMMRTLDIGGDKILPYFPMQEENPFLGWRGIRITLDHPEIFLVQIRAMLRASLGLNNLHIMFPMISAVSELDEAIRFLHQARNELLEEGEDIAMPAIGVMLEVPSAIYQAPVLAERVDFLSVGSNDLIQYLLAVDRNNARVAELYSSQHPAVLRALQQAVDAAHQANKPISICGEMAGEPVAALLLLAMGFDTLSMSATRLPKIKWVIRQFKLSDAQALLKEVLTFNDAAAVRQQVELALEKAGLGGLIRAGGS